MIGVVIVQIEIVDIVLVLVLVEILVFYETISAILPLRLLCWPGPFHLFNTGRHGRFHLQAVFAGLRHEDNYVKAEATAEFSRSGQSGSGW